MNLSCVRKYNELHRTVDVLLICLWRIKEVGQRSRLCQTIGHLQVDLIDNIDPHPSLRE